ncbi:MAG: M15 family metallopeptidase [Oliverpabstia sp.]
MYEDLCRMLTDGSQEGCSFVVASGYRSRERQKELLEEDIRNLMNERNMTYEQAWEEAVKETMPPGCSEHETGLAVDIVSAEYQLLDEGQEDTAEYQWLKENCSKYGFILRYPSDKTDITGINYEPWHFRYVGAEAAQEITEQGLTLEEYISLHNLI